jgi:hypothetical protein
MHNYVSKFQEEQYNVYLNTFPLTSILLDVDFAKNYSFQDYNEIQEMHWHSFQIIVFIHICYQWNPTYLANPTSTQKKLLIEYHYYISNDNEHDRFFVQHYFELHWAQLTSRNICPNEHLVWFDGCTTQFK